MSTTIVSYSYFCTPVKRLVEGRLMADSRDLCLSAQELCRMDQKDRPTLYTNYRTEVHVIH